ncbi:MAG: D-alanyl-D-alanine carboxypeptidase family protein [Acidobacteria bacterium]|nr:D-alanyl-D-alanine carboxypeptidase family protein [Acidobacteriota bacterium]
MASPFVKKLPLLLLVLSLALSLEAFGADRAKAKTTTCTGCLQRKSGKKAPCHPANYVDPKIKGKYTAALRDMKRFGVEPKITSAWRSTDKQAALYRCSNSQKCRSRNPGLYYAKPPGTSAHEAGLAVDISGVAAGPRGAKRITPKGHKIIRIMEKNGFAWRYGLKDPAHFEANPKAAGYRNLHQAIKKTQTKCSVNLSAKAKR